MSWLFRRLAWTLSRDDLKAGFYRAKVSALAFFLLGWLPLIALSLLLPQTIQDLALLSTFPVTGTVFWLGLHRATRDGPPTAEPILDGPVRRSLRRLAGGYALFLLTIGLLFWVLSR